jgi:hypothetical protein
VAVHPARIKKLESKIYEKFRMAFSEYYLNLILLQNYQVILKISEMKDLSEVIATSWIPVLRTGIQTTCRGKGNTLKE